MTISPSRLHPSEPPALDSLDDNELDTLVWQSLASTHARFAEGGDLARRFEPEVAGFVALRDGTEAAWSALATLVGADQLVMLSGGQPIEPPDGWIREGGGFGFQMILDGPLATLATDTAGITELSADDVPQILELIALTQPGPFRPRTIELGHYYGVFEGGHLIAMAGERLQTPRFTEVSAVCTHPDARGRGLAAALSHHVAAGILTRGQRVILHVAEQNTNAKRVYERLGFTDRARLEFVAVRSPADPDPDNSTSRPNGDTR